MNEFELIQTFFISQPCNRSDVILGIGDDAAIVSPPLNQQLVITTDTLVAGVHFPDNTLANAIGHKSLAVNLSDLAAMGATPAWVTLALTLPDKNENWLTQFCDGFFSLAKKYNVQLIGGDLTKGALTISVTAHGFVPINQALTRNAAQTGDLIYVSNTLGDAALGLTLFKNQTASSEQLKKLNYPEPQINLGLALRGIATSAIDISDGLAADVAHILKASQKGAIIYVDKIPLSSFIRHSVSEEETLRLALSGGDDYELCFTVPKNKKHLVPDHCTCIGAITENTELNLQYSHGAKYNLDNPGYTHF